MIYYLLIKMDNCNNTSNNVRVSFDPGWNDPPKISYSATQTPLNRPRNFLNKRVAFPLTGVNANPVTAAPVALPPMPAVASIVPQDVEPSESVESFDSASTLAEVKNILLQLLENSCELGHKANDIKRRIDAMEQMWTEGKFNTDVQAQMKDLAYALRNNEPHKADALHRALMVNHVSAVGTWMPGVKQLVHLCIARSDLLAIDKD